MHIGETVRLLAVEPLVDPVPAPDDPGRHGPPGSSADVPAPAGARADREPVPART